MKITALLPMKGHSERVPNKNMRLFAGKPLYHCVASILQNSDQIETIIVNTDSHIIADDAIKHFSKVKIHERPESIQGDMVPMNDIIAYDLERVEGEHFLQTHSTNPLMTKDTLEQAVRSYFLSLPEYDSMFSVTKWQTRLYWGSGKPVNHDPKELLRTQDLSPLYEENSNMYFFSKKSFKSAGGFRIGNKPKMFVMNKIEAVDIDEETDFIIAETLYVMKRKKYQNILNDDERAYNGSQK
jgi:CMP-N-acetylneuraminic acid synthetase